MTRRSLVADRVRIPFRRPFPTATGMWVERDAWIIRLFEGDGRVGLGEAVLASEPGDVADTILTALIREAAAAMAEADLLEPRHLLLFKQQRRDPTLADFPLGGRSLESIEKAAIVQTLKRADGNRVKAAKALGIAASTLYEKMRRYNIA